MISVAAPAPISGEHIDPPPPDVPGYVEKLERSTVGRIGYRAFQRYSYANVGLLANGTAYYMILSIFSVLAFAYGVIALVGADELARVLTDALSEALPGLVGENGIDPEALRRAGVTAGVIGLVSLLYGGLGAVAGTSSSLHLIFGAPPDRRPFVKAKARQLLVLVVTSLLMALSFAAAGLTSSLLGPVLERLGLGSTQRLALGAVGLVVAFALDVLITWLLLGWLGGIRPQRRPRLVASLIGAVAVGLVKALASLIIGWIVAKPQYGAFAAPLAALFVFALLAQSLYVSAAIAGGISDAERPLEELQPSSEQVEALTDGHPPEQTTA